MLSAQNSTTCVYDFMQTYVPGTSIQGVRLKPPRVLDIDICHVYNDVYKSNCTVQTVFAFQSGELGVLNPHSFSVWEIDYKFVS